MVKRNEHCLLKALKEADPHTVGISQRVRQAATAVVRHMLSLHPVETGDVRQAACDRCAANFRLEDFAVKGSGGDVLCDTQSAPDSTGYGIVIQPYTPQREQA